MSWLELHLWDGDMCVLVNSETISRVYDWRPREGDSDFAPHALLRMLDGFNVEVKETYADVVTALKRS